MSIKKKVCHFSSVHHAFDTRIFYREARSLSSAYDVTIVAQSREEGIFDGIKIISIPKPANRFARFFLSIPRLLIHTLFNNYDLYHFHDPELIPVGLLLKLTGKKVIYDVHENVYVIMLTKTWLPFRRFFAEAYRFWEKLAAQHLFMIYVIARVEFHLRFAHKDGKWISIQNFANCNVLSKYRTEKQLNPDQLFYMGSMDNQYYDLSPLLQAMIILKQKGHKVILHVLGSNPEYTEKILPSKEFWTDIKEQVIFHGYLKMEEGYELSKNCKVGICLISHPENILLSHQRKFFEFMAAGLPVLCPDYQIYKEIVDTEQTGICVNPLHPVEIAEALKKILSDDLNSTFAANCIKAAENKFCWEKEEQKLIDFYSKIVKTG